MSLVNVTCISMYTKITNNFDVLPDNKELVEKYKKCTFGRDQSFFTEKLNLDIPGHGKY